MSFWAELKRRNVVKVGAAYAVLGWLILQIANNLFPPLGLPPWTQTLVAALLLLGFPLVLLLAWIYEITPEGIQRTSEVPREQSVRHVTSHRLNYIVTGLLVLAVAAMALDSYVWRRPDGTAFLPIPADPAVGLAAPTASGATGPDVATSGDDPLPNSVAVLPFDNLSADPEHAYFAVGIHEEILNRLAKIKSLSVTSRTSVLRYTSDRPPIPEIARTLNVETVMEGSVRYAGDRIQVAVQLIDAATDSHIWSETYPGDVSDLDAIFALQADIAMNVANALRAEFTPAQIAGIARPPTDSPEAYEFFLAAGDAADEAGGGESLRRALELIEEAITLDGNFAEAWARKSSVHSSLVNFGPLDRRAAEQEEAERAALRAIELDANSAVAYLEYGFALSQRGKPVESEHAFRKAEDLGGGTAVGSYGILLLSAGNFTKALAVFEGFRALNPLSPDAGAFLLLAYGFEGNIGAMKEEYQRGLALYGAWAVGDAFMVWLLLGNGDTAAAKEILARSQIGPSATIDTAVRENFDTPSEAVARLRELSVDPVNENLPALVTIAMWAAHFGDAQLALDVMERQVTANSQAAYLFWYPQMRDVRRSPRFKEIMRNAGFVDYWNEFGWPETCRPTVGDDFECD